MQIVCKYHVRNFCTFVKTLPNRIGSTIYAVHTNIGLTASLYRVAPKSIHYQMIKNRMKSY